MVYSWEILENITGWGDGDGENSVVLSGSVEIKGRAGSGKVRFIHLCKFEFAAPEPQGVWKGGQRRKNDIKSGDVGGMAGKTRNRARGRASPGCQKRRERWVKSRASRADRRRQTDQKKLKWTRRRLLGAFVESVPRQRDRRLISAIRRTCRNPAGWDTLPKERSAVLPFMLLQPDKCTATLPDP